MAPHTDKTVKCAHCRTPIEQDGNDHYPFCTKRCQLLDLDRWLAEDYRISMPVSERNALADAERVDDEG